MTKRYVTSLVAFAIGASLLLSGCGASNALKGAGIGAGTGAVIGAVIGKTAGNTAVGAAIGTAVGGAAGGIIGHQMDKQKKELEQQVPEAEVEIINEGEAIRVTFDSGILFASSSSALSKDAREALKRFSQNMKDNPDTDIKIVGHTDITGRYEYNMQLSEKRAESVFHFLRNEGVAQERMIPLGVGPDEPIADNGTKEGRAKNRRVEVYILPSAKMIKEAQAQSK